MFVIDGLLPGKAWAPATLTISNGPTMAGNINAQDIADNLVGANMTISGSVSVEILESVDLSTSRLGTPAGTLVLGAPTIVIGGNVQFGTGSLRLVSAGASSIQLNGTIKSAGLVLTSPKLQGMATQVNVVSPNASIAQALGIAISGAVINVSPGQYPGNYTVTLPVTLIGNMGDPLVPGADPNAPLLMGLTAQGNNIFSISNVANVTIEGFRFGASVDGNPTESTQNGIVASSADNIVITNNSFDSFPGAGAVFLSGNNLTATYNAFTDLPASGTTFISTSTGTTNFHDNTIVPNAPPEVPATTNASAMVMAGLLVTMGLFVVGRSRPARAS